MNKEYYVEYFDLERKNWWFLARKNILKSQIEKLKKQGEQFSILIKKADGLIACSTGPLHIASASSIFALGLYPPPSNLCILADGLLLVTRLLI